MLKKILPSQILWGISWWVIPFTVFTTLYQETFFAQASYNPYLSFNFYLGEVMIFLTLAAWLLELSLKKLSTKFKIKPLITAGIILTLTLISVIFANDKTNSLLAQIHILAGLSVFILLAYEITPLKTTQKIIISSLVFQSLIAIIQVILQKSIGLQLIGEPLIGADIAGVAKISLFGKTLIRGYGTFPHANILAGFLGVGILLSHDLPKKKLYLAAKIILWIGFILTFSKGAIIALLIAGIASKRIPWKIGWPILGIFLTILFIKINSLVLKESFNERLEYIEISLALLAEKPFGVGIGQFTNHLQNFADFKLQPWQYQPVHNIYLLITNELGIWASISLIGSLVYSFITNKKALSFLLFLTIIGLFDHYLISLPQGIILSGGILGLTKN